MEKNYENIKNLKNILMPYLQGQASFESLNKEKVESLIGGISSLSKAYSQLEAYKNYRKNYNFPEGVSREDWLSSGKPTF